MSSDAAPMNSSPERTIRAIFEHAAIIGREQQIEELVRLNADFARDLIGADRCSLWLIDLEKNELWTKVAHGVDQLRIPMGEGLIGACIRDNQVLLVTMRPRNHGCCDEWIPLAATGPSRCCAFPCTRKAR